MVFTRQGTPYAVRRRHPSNRHTLSTSPDTGCINHVPWLLFDKLRALLDGRLLAQRGAYTYLPPLEDSQLDELCTDVYHELIRRETDALYDWGDELSFCDPFKDEVRFEGAGAFQRLAWLPTNLFDGLARDIYFELCRRYPWLLWSHPGRDTRSRSTQAYSDVHVNSDHGTTQLYPKPSVKLDASGGVTPGCLQPSRLLAPANPGRSFSVSDALEYLDTIKNRFQNHPDVYGDFLEIMDSFKNHKSMPLWGRVSTIFAAHPALIEGFYLLPLYPVESFLGSEAVNVIRVEANACADLLDTPPMNPAAEDCAVLPQHRPPEPFSKTSILCLDGRIIRQSSYAVASGGYADIWTGTFGSHTVAIKIMRAFSNMGRPIRRAKLLKRLWREYLAWSRLSHPNILECVGFSYDFTPQSEYEIPSLISRWMVNGTVLAYLETYPNVDRLKLLVGIAAGLAYLHGRDPAVIHGDLRGGNILVSDAGVPRLTDFGLSRILSDTRGMTTSSEPAGSVRWMSPELLRGDMSSKHSDVWAYGMTVLEILTGKRPYYGFNLEPVVLRQIVDGKVPSRPMINTLTDELWCLCQQCWRFRPIHRPSIDSVLFDLGTLACRGVGPLPSKR